MIRWLIVARAEAVRDFKLSLRYPIQIVTGVVILYVLFMGIFTGAALLAGGGKAQSFGSNLDALVIGYCMWFFAVMAINSMSVDIENEARQGTLEQIWLHTSSFLSLIWIRGLVKVFLGSGMVILLSLLIQLTTNNWLAIRPAQLLPLAGVILLTVIGIAGFGLILGGISLVFKRIGQLSALIQFGMFFLAYVDVVGLPQPWSNLIIHLPLAGGVAALKQMLGATAGNSGELLASIGWLAVDSLVYALLGSLVFLGLERVARKGGLLSHY